VPQPSVGGASNGNDVNEERSTGAERTVVES
jgi:hypothetical protein